LEWLKSTVEKLTPEQRAENYLSSITSNNHHVKGRFGVAEEHRGEANS